MWGFENIKEFLDYMFQSIGYFIGLIIVFGGVLSFITTMTHLIVNKGLIKIIKMIFDGIASIWKYLTK